VNAVTAVCDTIFAGLQGCGVKESPESGIMAQSLFQALERFRLHARVPDFGVLIL